MAFGRLERTSSPAPMAEINMTPLIDVMLVLLVIFMITAPLMTASLKLDLPKAEGQPASETPQALSLALTAAGGLYLGDEKINPAALDQRLAAAARQSPDTEVQLRADRAVPYGRVAELIGQLQKVGLNRIAFVTEPGAAASAAR
ncbi:MAG: ExbD/TolR family protein [Leptothrix sp. (in: b-proteobacteria)]